MDEEARRLMNMKEQLSEASLKLAGLDGRLGDMEKQLEKKTGHSDLEKAEKVQKKLLDKLTKNEEVFREGMRQLEQNYEWDR